MNRRSFLKKSFFSSIVLALSPIALKKQTPEPAVFFMGNAENHIKMVPGEGITIRSEGEIKLISTKEDESPVTIFPTGRLIVK